MQIVSDSMKSRLSMGFNNSRDTVGIVIKTSKDLGDRPILGVIIPKFMMGYDFKNGDTASEVSSTISDEKFINDKSIPKFGSDNVMVKNYILVRPLLNQNTELPRYTVGDRVIIGIIDDDIKTLVFYPYSINRLGQRAIDHYFVSVPANPEENIALTSENTYYFKMDSEEQLIELSSNEENGETTKQRMTFNSKEGIITITDDKDRTIELNTNDDKIELKTSGASITLTGDVIDITGDVCNIKTDTSINLETDKFNLKTNSATCTASDAQYKYDNFKQESQVGEWKVDNEKHSGMSMSIKESTYHNKSPMIGLNGLVIFPSFQIGAVPNINITPPSTNGISGPSGSMCMQTDPTGMPLVKYPILMPVLATIAATADAGAKTGTATAMLSQFADKMMTTKILSS